MMLPGASLAATRTRIVCPREVVTLTQAERNANREQQQQGRGQ